MNQQENEPQDIAVKHKFFEELHLLVDRTLRGLGEPNGITPHDEQTIRATLPPASMTRCRWELCDLDGFYLGDNKLVKIDIAVSPLRIGKNKGRKREEVTVDITWENPKRAPSGKASTMSRRVILTATREAAYRDLWVNLPEIEVRLRWSLYHGFVKYDLGGAFLPASLPSHVDDVTETMLVYSLMLTITGLIENLKRLNEINADSGSIESIIGQL